MVVYLMFLWMYAGTMTVAAYSDVLSQKTIKDIKGEKIELSRFSLGLNMAIYAIPWPLTILMCQAQDRDA